MSDSEGCSDNTTGAGEMIEETARGTIGCVNGAKETYDVIQLTLPVMERNHTPSFGQQFSDSCRLQLGEESTTVNGPEVTDISLPVELFGDDSETRSLLQIKTRR